MPEETFAEAQAAMECRDWEAFFACFAPGDVRKFVRNGVSIVLLMADDEAFGALCEAHRFETQELRAANATADAKLYSQALRKALRRVPDLTAFAAALERHTRGRMGGGSVSASLFLGETLEDLVIEGDRAWATRRITPDFTEDVGFEKRGGVWFIRLFARRPRKTR